MVYICDNICSSSHKSVDHKSNNPPFVPALYTFNMANINTHEKVHSLSPWVSYWVEGIGFKKINPQMYVCLGVSTNGTQFGKSPSKNKWQPNQHNDRIVYNITTLVHGTCTIIIKMICIIDPLPVGQNYLTHYNKLL
jgi:hypothetical protein